MTPNQGLALRIALAGMLLAGPIHAQTVIEWRAPSGCPGYDHVVTSVDDLAPGALAEEEPASRFVAEVTGLADGRWRLDLRRIQGGSVAMRQLEGDSCEAVADAAAAAIALALRPLDDQDELWSEPAEETPVTPPAPHDPAEQPRAPARDDRTPAAPRRPSRDRQRERPTPLAWALGGADLATFPGAAGTVELGLGLRFARGTGVEAYGVLAPTQRYRIDAATEATFALYAGGLRACAQSAEGRIDASVCGGIESGVLVAEGGGERVTPAQSQRAWVAPNAGLRVSWPLLKRVRLAGQGTLLVPLVRHEFRIDPVPDLVHRLPRVSGRLLVGVEIKLR